MVSLGRFSLCSTDIVSNSKDRRSTDGETIVYGYDSTVNYEYVIVGSGPGYVKISSSHQTNSFR